MPNAASDARRERALPPGTGVHERLQSGCALIFFASDKEVTANESIPGEAKKRDGIQLEFVPEVGTRVMVKGQVKGTAILDEDSCTAVLRIWCGDKPADAVLKKGQLGA